MRSAGKVYDFSGRLVNAATDEERNVMNNNFKLILTPRMILLGVNDDCPNIPCHHLRPFVSLLDVPQGYKHVIMV